MRIITLFLLSLTIGWTQEQKALPEKVSIEEAVIYGIENNRAVINANREVQKAEKEKWSAIATGLPQIDVNINYQDFLEQPISLVPAKFFGGKEGEFEEVAFGTKQNVNATIRLNQLIFDGSYIVGLQAAKVFLETHKNSLGKTVLEIRKNIVSVYSTVLLAYENIAILKKNKANLKANLSEIDQLFKNGLAEEESVDQIQLTLSKINMQLQYAENFKEITLKRLKLLMGFPIDKILILSSSLKELIQGGLFKIEVNKNWDLTNNIDVRIALNKLDSEKLLYKLEKSKALPRLKAFLSGSYAGNSDSFTFFNQDQDWFGSSILGVSLEIPVFSSLKRSAQIQKARISVDQSQTNVEDLKERVRLEILTAQNEYDLAIGNYFNSEENMVLAESIEKKNQTKFFEGMASASDLRQARNQLYTAQNDYIQSIQNVILKKLELKTLLNIPNKHLVTDIRNGKRQH